MNLCSMNRANRAVYLSFRRLYSSRSQPPESEVQLPSIFHVGGAGTGVGKTVLAAALIRSASLLKIDSLYVKPVQSGYPDSNDSAFVQSFCPPPSSGPVHKQSIGTVKATTIAKLSQPASPDLALVLDGSSPELFNDRRICHMISSELTDMTRSAKPGWFGLIEGAGGVLSPTPSGSLQADMFRPFRFPSILVGDSALGGISNTISAFEALKMRGFDVPAVVLFENSSSLLENETSIARNIASEDTSVFCAPSLPPPDESLISYYDSESAKTFFYKLLLHLRSWQSMQYDRLSEMSIRASDVFWYPFTQHKWIRSSKSDRSTHSESVHTNITAIDSAHGNCFMVYDSANGVKPMFDAVGSWWTNGTGHGHPRVASAIGSAAGRYGHVIFPGAVHEPAWKLADLLLNGPGRGWADRVFYSDNGSTAVEVSLKMAFRKRSKEQASRSDLPFKVVTVEGSYHGDTLGAMDCSPKSDFNSSQTPWYEPRNVSFHAPTVAIVNGVWTLIPSEGTVGHVCRPINARIFADRNAVFGHDRNGEEYDAAISSALELELSKGTFDIGALLIEPVMLGAGGMRIVDPAFQRALIRVCRGLQIPIVFDEVFTGIWRLGTISGAELLGSDPDIASYAKLLTGGTVPLAATLATEDVFQMFLGDSKREALLHGHSYTAHAIGCSAAVESLNLYRTAELFDSDRNGFGDFWVETTVRELSCLPVVKSATMLGTVLAVELHAVDDSGYCSTAGERIISALGVRGVFARPLGNVVYILCSPLTCPEESKRVCAGLMEVLHNYSAEDVQEASQ